MPYRVTLPPYRSRFRLPRAPLQFVPSGTHNVEEVRIATAQDTWTIAHNRGRRPAVYAFTDGWALLAASVVHLNENVVQITHNVPLTGWVLLVW
jgi:hypothetical protein